LLPALWSVEALLPPDLPGSWTPPSLRTIPALGPASNWYLRGDNGYGWFRVDRAESAPGFPNPSVNAPERAMVIGGGVGYKGSWLRTDVTLDYSATAYRGTILAHGDTTATRQPLASFCARAHSRARRGRADSAQCISARRMGIQRLHQSRRHTDQYQHRPRCHRAF
jgi:opacity protein-like surface antigen